MGGRKKIKEWEGGNKSKSEREGGNKIVSTGGREGGMEGERERGRQTVPIGHYDPHTRGRKSDFEKKRHRQDRSKVGRKGQRQQKRKVRGGGCGGW